VRIRWHHPGATTIPGDPRCTLVLLRSRGLWGMVISLMANGNLCMFLLLFGCVLSFLTAAAAMGSAAKKGPIAMLAVIASGAAVDPPRCVLPPGRLAGTTAGPRMLGAESVMIRHRVAWRTSLFWSG